MNGFVHDFRFALRLLGKSPVLTAVAVASLALGIGATTAVFSLIDALLLRPFPAVHAPEELVAVLGTHAKQSESVGSLSWANYLDYASHPEVVSGLAAVAECDLSLTHGGPAERLSGLAVSPNYFAVLGVKPAYGRFFSPGEERTPIAVLGQGLWRRRFGADPKVIGSSISLNGKRVTVVGIAPDGFWGTRLGTRGEIWLPAGVYSKIVAGIMVPFSGQQDRKQEWLATVGRLAPGVSVARAQNVFNVVAKGLAASYPDVNAGRGVRVLPLSELALGQGGRPRVQGFTNRLMAVVALVLAVAAINLAGLLLARALARRREIAVRLSLGASRGRLVRQLFIEGLVLGLFGAGIGVALARAGLPLLERLELPVSLAVREIGLSGRALGFAFLVSLASCLVFALVPALQAVRMELAPGLRGEAPRGSRLRFGLRELLVGVQVALALLILIASGLMLRTLANLGSIRPGFDPARVLVVSVDLAAAGYQKPRVAAFYQDLLERLRRLPQVEEASMASALPVMGSDLEVTLTVEVEGAPPVADPALQPGAHYILIGNRYFQTVGGKLLRGRDFGPRDEVPDLGAVIVNETAARRFWPGRDPLGRRLKLVGSEVPFEVIGMAADSTYASFKEKAAPALYLAHSQADKSEIGALLAPQMALLVRTAGKPRQALGAVRETVRAMDPLLPVFGVKTLEELLASTVGVERQAAALYSGLALVAVALAMLGLYGVLSHAVAERTREIGIRMACGASPREVRGLVLRRSAFLALAGVAAGLAVAMPASRIVESQLYGVKAEDPVTWLSTVLILVSVALLVSAVPARRAARIDPVTALRYQ